MFIVLGDLLEGILSFFADLWLVRNRRSRNGRPENSWKKDAADLAYVEWWLSAKVFAVAVVVFAVLFYGLGLPFGWSFWLPVAPAAVYCAYRWWRLTRD